MVSVAQFMVVASFRTMECRSQRLRAAAFIPQCRLSTGGKAGWSAALDGVRLASRRGGVRGDGGRASSARGGSPGQSPPENTETEAVATASVSIVREIQRA